ncbi:hypothetical protein GIB67_041460 [Kingdonia uniflora]|uniref:Protein kinase domain-containing protein n=1 Tax=Kingdonia uniflora TaxID=39325 RepID=A0A7J7LRJ2_9MAGN|nr:hypothetical protein GIB67_041460 [Kingdonia uniflora]
MGIGNLNKKSAQLKCKTCSSRTPSRVLQSNDNEGEKIRIHRLRSFTERIVGFMNFLPGRRNSPCLSWKSRCRIAVNVTKALAYLHRDCHPQILHLDIKPENILLDDNFRAVVSDFGLSELMKEDESRFYTKMMRGSNGYMAPEWLTGTGISEKCDIFSFGKVLLDLFYGRERHVCLDQNGNDIYIKSDNSQQEQRIFHAFMWEKFTQKELLELIDKRLKDDEKEASCLVHAALLCLEDDRGKRPGDMRKVVNMLQGITGSPIEQHLVPKGKNLDPIGAFEQQVVTQNNIKPRVSRLPFSYEALKTATNNFRDKLGSGGSSSVFRANWMTTHRWLLK